MVVPALNEERNLPYVFERLPDGLHEVILVDGGSTDRTVQVATELRPDIVVVHQTRTGKGNALACGFAMCTGDIVVMIDADGSTDPAEIPRFVAVLTAGADLAKGTRFRDGGGSHDITRLRQLGNAGLNLVVNVLFGTRFSDLCYGYNAFWRRALPGFDLPDHHLPGPADGSKLWGDGFEIETLLNVRAAAEGLSIAEVGSVEGARLHGVSNLNAPRDGLRVLRTILVEFRRNRRRRTASVELTAPARPSVPRQRPHPTGVVARHPVPGAAPGWPAHIAGPRRPEHDTVHGTEHDIEQGIEHGAELGTATGPRSDGNGAEPGTHDTITEPKARTTAAGPKAKDAGAEPDAPARPAGDDTDAVLAGAGSDSGSDKALAL